MQHKTGPGHPECPNRYSVIEKALKEAHLLTEKNTLHPRIATRSEILLCHTPEYYDTLVKDIETGFIPSDTEEIVFSQHTLAAARLAVGGVLVAIDQVMQSQGTAFCLVRPPGHHATPSKGMGFCLFNNVAIGARYVQKKYGIQRVLIVDWDVHHGNGTQEIFQNDPSVFYFSTHQKGIYPLTAEVETTNCYPIEPDCNAANTIIHIFEKNLIPEMDRFRPEFILISCGFDALYSDPLGHLNLTPKSFATLTGLVKRIAKKHSHGRIVSALEGGYDLNGIGQAAVSHVQALKDES